MAAKYITFLYSNGITISPSIDLSRIPKDLFTDNCDGVPISWLQFHDGKKEAEAIAEEILRVQKYTHGMLNNEDFAILVRRNAFSLDYEQALSRLQIPYRVVRQARVVKEFTL